MINPNVTVDMIAKIVIIFGVVLILVGIILLFFPKISFLGKLPGDIRIEKENFRFYFPITTSIVISIILSLILTLILRLFKKE